MHTGPGPATDPGLATETRPRVIGQGHTPDKRVDLLGAQLTAPMSVAEIAAGLCRAPFPCIIKATTSKALWAHLQRHLCQCAMELLQTTRLSIAEIAHRTGFGGRSHLTLSFGRQFGTTPGTVRDRH